MADSRSKSAVKSRQKARRRSKAGTGRGEWVDADALDLDAADGDTARNDTDGDDRDAADGDAGEGVGHDGEPTPTVDLRRTVPAPPSEQDRIRVTGRAESRLTRIALRVRHPRPPRALRRSKIGGVAPYVAPKSRLGRWSRMRDLGRRGYVPLSPGRTKLRHRILPRTVIGISTMLLMLGIGAAFSGAAFYAYYDNRLAENEQAVSRFVEGFDQQFTDATGAIDQLRVDSVTEIRDELRPLGDYVADADGVINLPQTAGPSVWLLESRDENGEIITGSAFAVVEHRDGTALVTSYALVVAATTEPSPGIDLIKGNERLPAQLWAWDAERDVALVVVDRRIPLLTMASERGQLESVGARVFALAGVGGSGATASPGVLLDHSQIGLQHTAPIGTLFRGGPLLNGEGEVLGVASDHYRPFGIDPGDVRQAPDVRAICVRILECEEIQEEFTVEVTTEETDAPITTEDLVRETPTGDAADGGVDSDTTSDAPSEEVPADDGE